MNTTEFLKSNRNLTKLNKLSYELSDVVVDTKNGLIINSDGEVNFELAYEALYWGPPIQGHIFNDEALLIKEIAKRYNKLCTDTKENLKYSDLQYLEDGHEYIYLLHAVGWYPYGHLHDSLNRLFSLKDKTFSSPKLLCSRFNKVNDFELHVKAVGYKPQQIVDTHKLNRFVKIKRLFVGVNPCFYTSFIPEVYEWITKGYREVLDVKSKPERKFKLYLTRNHVVSGERGVVNDVEVVSFLKNQGFTILTGGESLFDIYYLFANAELIIAAHGSVLVNSIFCDEGCRIIEYCPSNRVDFSFRSKYKSVKNYEHLLVDADDSFNIEININELAQKLGV